MIPDALNSLVDLVGDTNMENGCYDGDITSAESHLARLMLICSEAAEAAEHIRDGRGGCERWYGDDGKPEGIPSELADIIIRVLDLVYVLQIEDFGRVVVEKLDHSATRGYRHGRKH